MILFPAVPPGFGLRALHREQSLFDDPGAGSSQIDNPLINQQPQEPQQQLHENDPFWGTFASFLLLAQGITIFVIVGVLIFCLRKHRHQSVRQRFARMAQIQDWATIRIPPASVGVADADAGSPGHDIETNAATGTSIDESSSHNEIGDQPRPRPRHNGREDREGYRSSLDRFLSMPRSIGNALIRPLRALRANIDQWATGSYDEMFLRQLMERMEAEQETAKEAAKEPPQEREARLREAFVKARMIWVCCDVLTISTL